MILLKSDENLLYTAKDYERIDNEDNERQGHRDDFERDYGRVIHSSAFRRLQGKTQVFGPSEGDFHRTRLTHTLEVAQIARGIVINLNDTYFKNSKNQIDISLIEAAALAHDLGHPPFGHQGERALNKGMQKFNSGFEGNAHTFRLLTHLEGNKASGLNLSRATLLGICKYPIIFDEAYNPETKKQEPPKANIFDEDIETWKWLIKDFTYAETKYYTDFKSDKCKHQKTLNKSLECSIVELADDIAYATHDLQDVLKYKLIQLDDFQEAISSLEDPGLYKIIIEKIKDLKLNYVDFDFKLKEIIRNLISTLIQDVSISVTDDTFSSSRLKFKAKMKSKESQQIIEILNQKLIYKQVILSQRLQTLEWRGGYIVEKLFDTLMNETKLLPNDKQIFIVNNEHLKARIVCDYIAGMTDKYAENLYKRLFESNGGRLFDL